MNDSDNKKFRDALKAICLPDHKLRAKDFTYSGVVEVAYDGDIFSPIPKNDLKQFIHDNLDFNSRAMVKSLDKKNWYTIYDHPDFERRIVDSSKNSLPLEEDVGNILYLSQGNVKGPITLTELTHLLKNKELILNDQISTDKGLSWTRIYQYEKFDRRSLNTNRDSLPDLPQGEVFDHSKKETNGNIQNFNMMDMQTEAIAGLAYIGNKKSTNNLADRKKEEKVEDDPIERAIQINAKTNIYKILFMTSVAGLILFAILFFKGQSPVKTTSTATSTSTRKAAVRKKSAASTAAVEARKRKIQQARMNRSNIARRSNPTRRRRSIKQRRPSSKTMNRRRKLLNDNPAGGHREENREEENDDEELSRAREREERLAKNEEEEENEEEYNEEDDEEHNRTPSSDNDEFDEEDDAEDSDNLDEGDE